MSDSIYEVILRYLGWMLDGIGFRPSSAAIADASSSLSTTDYATLISGFGGAVLGAAIASVVSLWTAKRTAEETRLCDEATRVDLETSAAFRTMIKATQITNSIETMIAHIMKGVQIAHNGSMPLEEIWKYVQPTTMAHRSPIEFDASDFVFLLKGNGGDLMSRAMMLSSRVAALEAGFDAYSDLRTKMQELLEDHTKYDRSTEIFVTRIPPELRDKAELRSIEMDNLLKSILRDAYEYKDDATQICLDLNEAAKTVFDGKFPITLSSVETGATS